MSAMPQVVCLLNQGEHRGWMTEQDPFPHFFQQHKQVLLSQRTEKHTHTPLLL